MICVGSQSGQEILKALSISFEGFEGDRWGMATPQKEAGANNSQSPVNAYGPLGDGTSISVLV